MKKAAVFLILLAAALACNQVIPASSPTSPPPTELPLEASATPLSPTPIPEEPTAVPSPTAEPFPGTNISFEHLSLVIPPGLATGATGTQFPPAQGEDIAPWEITPGHIQLSLEGYLLQDKFHQAQFFVYPADAYTALDPTAANNISFIQGMCCRAENTPNPDSLPRIPFFNAGQVFASNIQIIPFQNGQGVRFLTEYAQYFAFVNNTDLFYQYQGLTEDGQTYLIAILPVTAPVLPPNAEPQTDIPPGGIAQPGYDDPDADWEGYYNDISALLENTPPDSFTPTLAQLDALIRSIVIVPESQ